jgi:ubiquinone/menaquinone biosynthesis C-methylase UbiE
MEKRKLEEIEFHNKREIDRNTLTEDEYQRKYSNKKVYQISESSFKYLEEILINLSKDKICLDYCCGLGNTSLNLYKYGAKKVYGIDIAEKEVETAKKSIKLAGYDDSGIFVGDAEQTNFEDDQFDLIVCIGVLHHLDVNKAFKELHRILKPGGSVVAFEALGYNPIIQAYRKLTPHLRTDWEKDHILTNKELGIALKYFSNVKVKYFHLLNLILFPFTKSFFFKPALKFLTSIDRVILKIPYLRLMAWQMVFTLKK